VDTGDRFLFFSGASYPTLVALDDAFPNGAYTFRVTAGTLAPASASVSFPSTSMFPSAVPAFDAETVAASSSYDACKPFLFSWNRFVPDANATHSSARLSISQSPFGAPATFFPSTASNSMTVRAGILKPNTAYRATLTFSNERRTPNGGFGNFESEVSFTYFTSFEFTTLPETATDHIAIRVSQVELCWATATNALYQLQSRSSLSENDWNDVGLPIQGTGSCRCVYQDIVQGRPQRFYRVVTLPQ
jgi:hypothetical protein